jgi:hypothetical protein
LLVVVLLTQFQLGVIKTPLFDKIEDYRPSKPLDDAAQKHYDALHASWYVLQDRRLKNGTTVKATSDAIEQAVCSPRPKFR